MATEASEGGLVEQLAKLAKLHSDGILSDEEFAASKQKVISGSASVAGSERCRDAERLGQAKPRIEPVATKRSSGIGRLVGGIAVVCILGWVIWKAADMSNSGDTPSNVASQSRINLAVSVAPNLMWDGQTQSTVLKIVNKSNEKITIEEVEINNKKDDDLCFKKVGKTVETGDSYNFFLKFGFDGSAGACGEIVKAVIKTNFGTVTYTW